MKPGVGILNGSNVRPLVNSAPIPKDDDMSAQVPEQEPQEFRHVNSFEVILPELHVQPHPGALGGHGDCRDRRDTVMPVVVADNRSLRIRTPGSPPRRDEHEAASPTIPPIRGVSCPRVSHLPIAYAKVNK